MSTIQTNLFQINGVIDTNKPVMENLQEIASAGASWVTFDATGNLWSVILNAPLGEGTPRIFYDLDIYSNILGPITISGKGLTEFYDSVSFKHPHKDLNDQLDTVVISIPEADRYPNEIPNRLDYETDLVNDPVQMQYLASIELKQNRLDKIIRFDTDFSALGVRAGDIIEVRSSRYNLILDENALFRVISVEETDTDEGAIVLSITAAEHSDAVYDTGDLTRELRSTTNSISYIDSNTEIKADQSNGSLNNLSKSLLLPAALSAALRFANSLFNKKTVEDVLLPKGFQVTAFTGSYRDNALTPTSTVYTEYHTETFTPNYTGRYIGQFIFDQNNSGARGKDEDIVRVGLDIVDGSGTVVASERSGGGGSWFWTDWTLGVDTTLQANQTYTLKFYYTNNTLLGGNADITVNWNIFSSTTGVTA